MSLKASEAYAMPVECNAPARFLTILFNYNIFLQYISYAEVTNNENKTFSEIEIRDMPETWIPGLLIAPLNSYVILINK